MEHKTIEVRDLGQNPLISKLIFKDFFHKGEKVTLREKCPYSELFWPVFSPNAGKYGPE